MDRESCVRVLGFVLAGIVGAIATPAVATFGGSTTGQYVHHKKDARTIACGNSCPGQSAIFVGATQISFPVLGAVPTAPTTENHTSPAYSPDGSKIAFVRTGGPYSHNQSIMVMDASGANPVEVVNVGHVNAVFVSWGEPAYHSPQIDALTWSADGQKVVFDVDVPSARQLGGIWAVGVDGTGIERLVQNSSTTFRRVKSPNWAPYGAKLAYQCSVVSDPGHFDLCVTDTAAGGERRIRIGNPGRDGLNIVGRPKWTPDGARLLFHHSYVSHEIFSFPGFSSTIYKSEIFSVRSDGSGLKQLTDSHGVVGLDIQGNLFVAASLSLQNPAMSPDGQSIIAQCFGQSGIGLCLLGANGGTGKLIYSYPQGYGGYGGPPDWQASTEGLTIVVEDGHDHLLSSLDLELLDPSGVVVDPNPTVLLGGRYDFGAVPPGNYLVRARLKDAKTGATFGIFHNLDGEPVRIEKSIVVASSSTKSVFVQFDDSAGLHDTNLAANVRHRLDDLAFLYYRLHQYIDWIKDNVTPTTGRPVAVRAFFDGDLGGGPYPADGASYLGSADELSGVMLLGTQFSEYANRDGLVGPTGKPDEAPENGEWHEFNHHLYGEFINSEDCFGTNHGGYSNPDTCDSMNEGFSAFLALLAAQSIEGTDSTFYAGQFDLESGGYKAWSTQVGKNGVLTYREDAAVASLLWDLVDSSADAESNQVISQNGLHVPVSYQDGENLSLQELWLKLTTLQPRTIMELRQAIGSPALSLNLDASGGADVAPLDRIFLMQGFFPIDAEQGIPGHSEYHYDVARAQNFNPALPRNAFVGRSDHVFTDAGGIVLDTFIPREHISAAPGANLAVQVQDASGTPLAGARIDLEVLYPAPPPPQPQIPRTVSREMEFGESSLIPLELPTYFKTLPPVGSPLPPCAPASDHVVTVTLRAKLNGYVSSTVPSFDNCAYQQAVAAAAGDAAMSFTLTFPEDSTEPVTTIWKDRSIPGHGNGTPGFWQFELDCSDPVSGDFASGCHRTEFRVDGGPLTVFSETVRLDVPGVHVVEYRSFDAAGNVHPFRSQILGVGVDPDSDGDGLTDGAEVAFGTQFDDPDTDDDGLLDGGEFAAGSEPRDSDSDDDGLSDGQEVNSIGSSPIDRDSDDDGLEDPVEVAGGTSPIAFDTDADGLSDRAEIGVETSPIVFDSDGDSIGDGSDNCPLLANTDQRNRDANLYGDACDYDDLYTSWQLVGVTGDGANTPETLFQIDTSNASATFLMTLGNGDYGEAIAFNPADGLIYHASGYEDQIWESIDPVSLTIVASGPFVGMDSYELSALAHRPTTMRFLVTNRSPNRLFALTHTGNATFKAQFPTNIKGMAFADGVLYFAPTFWSELLRIDLVNWAIVSSVRVRLNGNPVNGMNGLARHPETGALWVIVRVSDVRHLGTIDPATGVVTSVGVLPDNFAGITFVPEPSHFAGLGSGVLALMLGGLRRRRRMEVDAVDR